LYSLTIDRIVDDADYDLAVCKARKDISMQLNMQQGLELRQQLKQILTPLMIQSLKILNLPYQELTAKVQQESEENIVVDIEQQDALLSYLRDSGSSITRLRSPSEEHFNYLDKVASNGGSLYDHLMVQLELEYLEEPDFSIANKIIENINDRGFLEGFPDLKVQLMKDFNVAENRIKSLLSVVQSFEPAGVGARNVKESLLLQIQSYSFEDDDLKEILDMIVTDYLEELARKDYETIAMELSIDEEDVERAAEFIENNLSPVPAESFLNNNGEVNVIPSFEIRKEGDSYVFINLEKEKGIKIRFNQKYLDLFQAPDTDEKTKEFIREKINNAKKLIDMISRRNEMMDKVGNILVERQKDYFDKGIHFLMPIYQKEIAEQVEVHSSTISRAIASKYIATPSGILPLKYLCPRQVSGVAVERVKYIIRDIVDQNQSFSDLKIAQKLEEFAIYIKRRTVAKYRSSIKLPSSFKRGDKK